MLIKPSFIVNLSMSTDSNRTGLRRNLSQHIRSLMANARPSESGRPERLTLAPHTGLSGINGSTYRTPFPPAQSLSRLVDPGQFRRPSIHHLYLNRKPRHSISYLLRRCGLLPSRP